MTDKPRTWTLEKFPGILDAVAVLKPKEMRVGQKIRVIELEPVLDLLERAYKTIKALVKWVPMANPSILGDLGALLREYGRLS